VILEAPDGRRRMRMGECMSRVMNAGDPQQLAQQALSLCT
jgi:hypothetical protein